ncbi:4-hydroxybenzoate 3-monooxygenase [Plantactinospora sp. KLBMP9567]|uniref:4-hydroxybenzoate 3-monooxygenase n=1 Tax=Plantactinospora sp. KLBMP9567 TaxID=3085900 RepID=UPI0029817485|nr:4-hydroxybenzoate 3-monooxygenase [Plantactinospora sp. KLBMP9567]MDW5330290.1 4-hydroxybenzoate 3-monooxygenase [Plantactinospora sp. KLBMP9567]
MRTQVAIVGAGPAGLMLSHLLHRSGIDSVVVERRSREYVEQRVRAGVLEQGTVDLLRELGVSEGLDREGLVHRGIELLFDGTAHRIPMSDLTGGRAITIYGQQHVVRDLTEARLAAGGQIYFEADDVAVSGVDTAAPRVTFTVDGRREELLCDIVAGCDGFHGVCRDVLPGSGRHLLEREYPFGWLGILAAVPPSADELIYGHHERGFALASLRSPTISRLYLQVDPHEDLANWSDRRIWDELATRLAHDRWTLAEGPILEKSITPMRSFVCEPMRHGRLFLAGDAAHIVPPTGAKGLNLAVHDVYVLAEAVADWYRTGSDTPFDTYSARCLRRVWRVQHFSWWMTSMLHRFPGHDAFEQRLQRSQLEYVVGSPAAATTLAENYVGLPWS